MSENESKRLEILQALQARQRGPFAEELAKWLANAPTAEAVAEYAKRNPDRWSQGVATLARAAGYSERLEVETPGGLVGFAMRVQGMSDAELETEYQRIRERAAPPPKPKVTALTPAELDRLPVRGPAA